CARSDDGYLPYFGYW
nr:immunoglobulin heavy chain junction region [Mus musculus]